MKILLINDMNYDFAKPDGKLYVPGGESTITFLQKFIDRITPETYDYIFIVNDLHFTGEYEQTEESKAFPEHCMYGTKGASMAVDITPLQAKGIPLYFMNKNYFSMWTENHTDYLEYVKKANPDNPQIVSVYQNLFCVGNNQYADKNTLPRDKFFPVSLAGWKVDVVGLASDYCVRSAVEGFLERGAEVTVLAEMTKGISKDIYAVAKEINNPSLIVRNVFKDR